MSPYENLTLRGGSGGLNFVGGFGSVVRQQRLNKWTK